MAENAAYILREYQSGDAAAVARLFNESEEGWPGGFTGGVTLTAEHVRKRLENMDNILILIAWHGEHAVGFLQMTRHWADPQAGYINLLNVHPEHRGRGIGTRLLKAALRKAVEEGLLRVDLHTWGGNERALRLYKKLGFMWVPGTRVYMQNYLPSLARFPGLKGLLGSEELFSFRKNLDPVEDGSTLHGRRLFVYDWGDGRRLIADYRSWKVTGATWPGVEVLVVAPERVVRGFPYRAVLEMQGVSWEPWSTEGVEVRRVGEEIEFTVKPGLQPVTDDEPSRSVGVRIHGWSIVLASGFKDYEPLMVEEVHPDPLNTGSREAQVSLVNRGGDGLGVTVYAMNPLSRTLSQGEGLVAVLPAHAKPPTWRRTIYYRAALSGRERVFSVTASAPVVAPNTVGYSVDEEDGVIEVATTHYRAEVYLRGGRVEVYNLEGGTLAEVSESVGPPLWPNEVSRSRFNYRMRWLGDKLVLVLTVYLPARAAWLEKRLVFHAAPPRIDFSYSLKGAGEKIFEISTWGPHHFDEKIWLPLRDGVVEIDVLPGETFPSRYALPVEPEAYSAAWAFRRRVDGLGVATTWSREGLIRIDFSWGRLPSLRYRVDAEKKTQIKFSLLFGLEKWEDAARAYGGHEEEAVPIKVYKELEPCLEPPIVSTMENSVDVVIRTWRRRRTRGLLKASLPQLGIEVSKEFTLDGENPEYRVTLPLALGKIGVYRLHVEADTTHGITVKDLPVIVLWDPGKQVHVKGGVADNGHLVLRVDPDYAGVLHSVEIGGVNNLYTPYPERGVLDWINPWFGGVQLEVGRARLWEEKWGMRSVKHGPFTGIEVYTRLEDKLERRLRGLLVRHQYLTLPGSNLLYMRLILENASSRILRAPPFLQVFARPGGELAEKFQLDYGPERLLWRRHSGVHDEPYRVSKNGFAAVYSGRGTVIAVSLARDWLTAAVCYGEKGCHFWFEPKKRVPLRPGERRVYESALLFLGRISEETAEMYSTLREAIHSIWRVCRG